MTFTMRSVTSTRPPPVFRMTANFFRLPRIASSAFRTLCSAPAWIGPINERPSAPSFASRSRRRRSRAFVVSSFIDADAEITLPRVIVALRDSVLLEISVLASLADLAKETHMVTTYHREDPHARHRAPRIRAALGLAAADSP